MPVEPAGAELMLGEQDWSDASVCRPGAGGGPQGVRRGGGRGRHEGAGAAQRQVGGQAAAQGARAPLLLLHAGLGHLLYRLLTGLQFGYWM